MPPKKQPHFAKPKEAPEPRNTYGLQDFPDLDQFKYDCVAFAKRIPIEQGAPPRPKLFRKVADKLLPGYFDWNDWTDRIVEPLCESSLVGFPGCSNCVAGDTRLLNPITGEQPTIKELCEGGIAPTVMTLYGPERAEIPYLKGVADLYEITLESGARFCATAEHRVLVSYAVERSRWFYVSELYEGLSLFSYGPKDFAARHDCIVSIRISHRAEYYDLCVPKAHHYFAEGAIHHNSGKTHNVVGFACAWWLMAPDISSVTLVSTSKDSLRKRGWAQVIKCYTTVPGPRFGNFLGSRMIWQAIKGDDKHAIFGKAVEEGPIQKVADDIKGVHTRRQMVVIDEATSVPGAILEACGNLYSYPEEFVLVLIGNPLNRQDQFGRFCEPKGGWMTVDIDTGEWESKPNELLGGKTARVVTFDAEKSPNITEGRVVCKHLPTKEKVEAAQRFGGGQTPNYWQNFRGFWPPEGLTKTVFSESALQKYGAYGKQKFTGRFFTILGSFDPAFGGGDRPSLRFAKYGELEGGKMGIQAMPPIIIPINANSTNPVHFQLAEQVKRQCEKFIFEGMEYSCEPENFATDATGEGGGLADIMQRTWSSRIIRIEYGGAASEDSVSLEDIRPAKSVYENKSVEMHFRARDAVNSGQLKGIDQETATELCNRTFDDSGKRIKLQSKKDYKVMFGKSPDHGDSLVQLLEIARKKGFQLAAVGETVHVAEDWQKEVDKSQGVYEDAGYAPEEAVEEMV